jgi:hypothetical protein
MIEYTIWYAFNICRLVYRKLLVYVGDFIDICLDLQGESFDMNCFLFSTITSQMVNLQWKL